MRHKIDLSGRNNLEIFQFVIKVSSVYQTFDAFITILTISQLSPPLIHQSRAWLLRFYCTWYTKIIQTQYYKHIYKIDTAWFGQTTISLFIAPHALHDKITRCHERSISIRNLQRRVDVDLMMSRVISPSRLALNIFTTILVRSSLDVTSYATRWLIHFWSPHNICNNIEPIY